MSDKILPSFPRSGVGTSNPVNQDSENVCAKISFQHSGQKSCKSFNPENKGSDNVPGVIHKDCV